MKKLLIIALLLGASVNAQTKVYNIFIDLTDEALVESYKEQIMESLPVIIRKNKDNTVELNILPITNIAGFKSKKSVLTPSPWYANSLVTEDKEKAWIKQVSRELDKFEFGTGYGQTRIYDNLNRIKSKTSTIIVFSDLIENSDDVSLYKSYPNLDVAVKLTTIHMPNVYFVRGIANHLDQDLIRLSDYAEKFWKQVIPGISIELRLDL